MVPGVGVRALPSAPHSPWASFQTALGLLGVPRHNPPPGWLCASQLLCSPRCCPGRFCGWLLPSQVPGAPVCSSWVVAPMPRPLGSKPASLPTCAWHRGELGRRRLAVGDSRPGPTWEQDGHFPSEARGLEARLQEQISPLRAWACPGCVRCVGLGTQGSSFRPREAPSPAGTGRDTQYPLPSCGVRAGRPGARRSGLCGRPGVSSGKVVDLWCHGWCACGSQTRSSVSQDSPGTGG